MRGAESRRSWPDRLDLGARPVDNAAALTLPSRLAVPPLVRPLGAALVLLIAPALAACGAPRATAVPGSPTQPASPAASAASPTASPDGSPAPSVGPAGFEFDAESVRLYYASLGYRCTDPVPSTQAADHLYRSCQIVDEVGRTLVVGLVTDPAGDLADAFASVQAPAGESFLDPVVALDPLAAFLGAMLGESRGEAMLSWLAGHLGDVYASTALGQLAIATYTESETDRSKLYVEIATPGYLESPTPAPS